MLRRTLVAASESERLRKLVSGVAVTRAVAERFVAGEELDDALEVVGRLADHGMWLTLDYLGEAVRDQAVARGAADVYLEALERLAPWDAANGRQASVSVKPSQLGLGIAFELAEKLIGEICDRAADLGRHVTIDMEDSSVTQATVDLVRSLLRSGRSNVGCAVQSYLHRTHDDVRLLGGMGASLRLCKGAYAEPPEIAYQERARVADNFVRCADTVLRSGTYGRFATHDDRVIRQVRNLARRHRVTPDRFEFQMLYGVREPLQRALLAAGHPVRVYLPFGGEWYPYLTRRLAERPANLLFFLRALAGRRA